MTTALPRIEECLYDRISDALADEKVKVVVGYTEAPELVAIFSSEFDRDYRLLGPNPVPLEERFRVDLIVEVLRPSGRDMRPASDRAWEIFALVEAAIREDDDLDEIAFDSRFDKGSREFFQTDKKQGARIRVTLSGTARI
jgi:hypothetical protein